MRQIKIRAWDTERKVMLPASEIIGNKFVNEHKNPELLNNN